MRRIPALCAALLLLIVLFPPADRVAPGKAPMILGDMTTSGIPEFRYNVGFTFLPEIGGPVQIRFIQWFVQMGVVVIIGGAALLYRSPPVKTP